MKRKRDVAVHGDHTYAALLLDLSTDAADQLVPMPRTGPAKPKRSYAPIPDHLNSALMYPQSRLFPTNSGALYWEGNSTGMMLRGLSQGSGRVGYLSLSGQLISDEERKRYE